MTAAEARRSSSRTGARPGPPRQLATRSRPALRRQRDRRADHDAHGGRGAVSGRRPAEAEAWHWGNHSLVTLHLALRKPPVYRSRGFDPDIDRAFNIFFGMDDIDQVRSCFDDCAAERFPDVLMGNGACNSAVDPTYAPADGHSASGGRSRPMRSRATRRTGTATRTTTCSACSACGGNMRPISMTRTCAPTSCSRRSISSGSTSTWCEARCGWAPISPRSSASIVRIRCCPERAPRSRGFICADPRPATAAASTARPATSPRMRSWTTSLDRPWTRVPAPEWRH